MKGHKKPLGIPVSWLASYGLLAVALVSAGVWLAHDLVVSRESILAERSALAVQTSRFLSQWFGTTILTADYVLRDLATKVEPSDLDRAGSDPREAKRLSALARQKLGTLPGVMGLGLLDKNRTFVAAADEHVIGVRSHSQLTGVSGQPLEDRASVEYVPASQSANHEPALLVSRPLFSAQGEFVGGVLAAISLRSAQGWLETFSVEPHDTLALLDGDGTLLAAHPSRPEAIGHQWVSPPGTPNLGDQRSSASFVAASPVDGRHRIYGLSKVENIPLTILVGYDEDRTLREWLLRAWQLVFGLVLLAVLFGVVVALSLRTLGQQEQLRQMAVTDPLTGVANRRQLTLFGEREIAKALRYQHKASILMVDIDQFKSVNDTWGHPTGDRVVQSLAQALSETVRRTDLIGRLGGDEFVAVLPGTDSGGAFILAQRIREFVEQACAVPSDRGTPVPFTVSIGVASTGGPASTFETVLAQADAALYEAKNRGRNTVVLG